LEFLKKWGLSWRQVTESISHLQPRISAGPRVFFNLALVLAYLAAPVLLLSSLKASTSFIQEMLTVVIEAPARILGPAVDLAAPGGTGTTDKLAAAGGAGVSSELWAAGAGGGGGRPWE